MQQRANTSRRTVQFAWHLKRVCILALGCAFVSPCVVGAQTCVGLPGPEGGRIQLGAGYSSSTGTSQFGVYAGGVGSTVFGQAHSVTTNYEGFRGDAVTGGVSLGYRLPFATSSPVELCPVVGGAVGGFFSTADGRRQIASTRAARVGLSLGYRIEASRSFAVLPTVSASFEHASLRQSDIGFNSSTNYGTMRVATGLVMGTRFTAYPSVSVPFGIPRGQHSWGLAFTLSIWQKRP